MKNILVLITCGLMMCCQPSGQKDKKAPQEGKTKYFITLKGLSESTLTQALEKYGKPLEQETFVLGIDPIHEFRVGLLNIFSKTEVDSKTIHIKEITWEKDKDYKVTVWYRKKEDKWIPVDILEWDKDEVF
ncbi:hypothetical protein [Sinomicrobium weinanense]|uniref:Uncharacterized protein n=1 Tax=Sinomicrobium weinanense TaxID=2842200 RepID=A0A926JUN6_9FLAO|nr:hypothetical protein [Sinomicrobium weinanense]MBC9797867.1 hypothetical protein [Sinomicrobium weinanense]MBU3122233.1 hypothetical protein [Sinomicrobium weinanense]